MRSIRVKLVLLVLVSIIPALAVIVYSEQALRGVLVRNAHEKSLMIVLGLASEHERTVESTRRLLSAIAKTPVVRDKNIPLCTVLLHDILEDNPIYANLFLVNTEGMVFASGRQPFKPHSVTGRKYFLDATSTGNFSVGEYTVDVTAKVPVLHFAQPLLDADGKVKLLIVAAVDLERYGALFPHSRLPEGTVVSLLDHKGIRLYRYPGAEKYSGMVAPSYGLIMKTDEAEGTFRSTGPDGLHRLSAYKRFALERGKAPYLFMIVGIPEKVAFSQARRVALISTLFLGLAVLMAVLLAWLVGRAIIVKRLRKLVRVSQELGRGDLAVRTGMDHAGDELGVLAKSFDEMATSLENLEAARRHADETVRRSEERYRSIFENAIEGIFQTTPDGKFISANPCLTKLLGYDSPEDLMEHVTDIGRQLYVNPKDREKVKEALETKGMASGSEVQLRRKDGSPVWVSLSTRLIREEGGTFRFEGAMVDITERKLAENALRESERKLADIIEFLPDATFVIDIEGKVIAWNRALEEMTGISKKDMIGQGDHAYTVPFYGYRREQLLDLIDTSNADLESKYNNIRRSGKILAAEVFTPALYGGKGAYIWATGAPLFDDKGNRVGAIESMRDITARKQAEQLMQASLREKEVLLKEIQHRVKNNLLTISGIVSLQLDQITDEASRDVFIASMNRINAIRKMHTRIYQSEDYSRVSSRTCIMELLLELSRTYGFPAENIAPDIEDIPIDVNTAIPVGLMVNELVSNAMKHAFPRGEKGIITVEFHSEDGHMRLAVRDDGEGFPPGADITCAGTIGLQLISALIEQLEGSLEFDREKGAGFTITFPRGDSCNG